MLSNALHRLVALPVWAKTLLVSVALVVPGPSALSIPLAITLPFLALIGAGLEGKRHA